MKAKRVLIVDDETNIRDVLRICLNEFAGWEVVAAGSGSAGLIELAQSKPDAVLLDLMMPEMDGLTFLRLMKDDPSYEAIPVVLLTSKISITASPKLPTMGVVGAISKPFNPLLLANQVAALLSWDLICQ